MNVATGAAQQLTFGEGNDLLADVAPDGKRVVFDVDVTSAPLFAYKNGARSRVTPARVILIDPQVTPDGSEIIAADFAPLTARIVSVRIADGTVRSLADGVIATITPDGAYVIFATDGVPSRVKVVPLTGGTPRTINELPGRIRALRADAAGEIHAMVDRVSTIEAWKLGTDGQPVREADSPWCFVQPAPTGGWTLWMRCAGDAPTEGVLVAPGKQPDPNATGIRMRGPMFFGGDFDASGTAFFAYDQPSVEKIDVATGAVTHLFDTALYGATPSPDGATVYTTEPVGSVRRHLIANFADRPRP
jgi:hypothetical protein